MCKAQPALTASAVISYLSGDCRHKILVLNSGHLALHYLSSPSCQKHVLEAHVTETKLREVCVTGEGGASWRQCACDAAQLGPGRVHGHRGRLPTGCGPV